MKNQKETYKHLTVIEPKKSKQPLYPNAADDAYFAAKALNIITAIVSGVGFTSAMLFLATMA